MVVKSMALIVKTKPLINKTATLIAIILQSAAILEIEKVFRRLLFKTRHLLPKPCGF